MRFEPGLASLGSAHLERRRSMCLTCGCGEPDADHGDPRHITMQALKDAADAAEIDVDEAAGNLQQTYPKGK